MGTTEWLPQLVLLTQLAYSPFQNELLSKPAPKEDFQGSNLITDVTHSRRDNILSPYKFNAGSNIPRNIS
jgi:hypothetical protein